MLYLCDTNVLLRFSSLNDPNNQIIVTAIDRLIDRGDVLLITPQNMIEFWSVATRAVQYNGFGLTLSEAAHEIGRLKTLFQWQKIRQPSSSIGNRSS